MSPNATTLQDEILGTIPKVDKITTHICMESPKDLRG